MAKRKTTPRDYSNRTFWRPEEEALIEDLIDYHRLPYILRKLRILADKNGWAPRTEASVRIKIARMGYKLIPKLDNFTLGYLAKMLGISRDRTLRWARDHGLKSTRISRSLASIKLRNFKSWAHQHPERLAGINAEKLNWFMEDKDFCRKVESTPRKFRGSPTPVKNLKTGQVFSSVREAARSSHVTKNAIPQAIARGGTSAGAKWQYLEG